MTTGKVIHVNSGEPYDLYVGRAMPRYGLKKSAFANPYRIGPEMSRQEALERFERLMRNYLDTDEDGTFAKELRDLHGKTLACWCAKKGEALTLEDPEVCHAQVLLRLAWEGVSG